jgi:hypothetical protein
MSGSKKPEQVTSYGLFSIYRDYTISEDQETQRERILRLAEKSYAAAPIAQTLP